ncbi:CrcB family protein [Entomomonas moraniae]|uniref:CrcB family protein n=1 Tax=Entomomonas moraniae TaxID=2213226 RepID=UPI001E51E9AD|nr:CrcB family protein [Entomomonas moraniae]
MLAIDVLWVGIGGGIGSLLRWWIGVLVAKKYHHPFPLATFLINISGAFIIAYLSVFFGRLA